MSEIYENYLRRVRSLRLKRKSSIESIDKAKAAQVKMHFRAAADAENAYTRTNDQAVRGVALFNMQLRGAMARNIERTLEKLTRAV